MAFEKLHSIDAFKISLVLFILSVLTVGIDHEPICEVPLTHVFPNIDGTCHNLDGESSALGSSNRPVNRLTGRAAFADGTDRPIERGRPSPRLVSNEIIQLKGENPKSIVGASLMFIYMGQFIDHDITLVEVHNHTTDIGNRLDIPAPAGDPTFDPNGRGTESIPFGRSIFDRDSNGVRQFRNSQTPWLDLSQVYGHEKHTADLLRAHDGTGYLKMTKVDGNSALALNRIVNVELEHNSDQSFACGDIRCNEHPVLLALTTLFAREHNRLARHFKRLYPDDGDDLLFNKARKANIYQYQQIVFEEWLPMLLGKSNIEKLIGPYRGYKTGVDPATNELFRLAAFRFGHSGLLDTIALADANDNAASNMFEGVDDSGHARISRVFFRPDLVFSTHGAVIDLCLNGVQHQTHSKIDVHVVEALRSELFKEVADRQSFDLTALNMQRARDHGLPPFDEERAALHLKPYACAGSVDCVAEVTGDLELAKKLIDVYGDYGKVDAFVAGLAEKPFGDGQMGETWTVVIADQFRRLRDGDRFFYGAEEYSYPKVRMHDILNRNLRQGRRSHNAFISTGLHERSSNTTNLNEHYFNAL